MAAVKGALVLVLASVLLGEIVTPHAERVAHQRRSMALADRIALHTEHGFWVRDGNSFINVRELLPDNRMGDLYIYEFDDALRLRTATHAERGSFVDGQWILEGVESSVLGEDGVSRRTLERSTWHSQFRPDLADVVSVRLESLSATGLFSYIGYLGANGLDTARYELALWSKIVYPLATVVMILLALPLVLGPLGSTGTGHRIVVGVLIAIGFHVMQQASGHVGLVYGVNPLLSVLAAPAVFLVPGLWLLRKVG